MNRDEGTSLPADLTAIKERLRSERPVASGVELDELKLRAMRQARRSRPSTRPGGQLLKSRLALLTMIVVGIMMSTTGATLAITGSSGSGNAASNHYGAVSPQQQGGGGPESLAGAENQPDQATGPSGSETGAPTGDTQQVQAADTGSKSLPFTGLLAIPLLVGGVALVSGGALLRRRTSE